ncbi:MAG: DUF4157 domain-containing protein [Balneolaceae bacterium]|nr:DUF4157 domain-containing protein [Balneolaceae bacterium]
MKTSTSTSKTESNASFHTSHLNKENKPAFFSQKVSGEMFFGPATLQPKLEIGSPDDAYEREADRVADQVIRMSDPAIQKFDDEDDELQMKRKSAIQMKCDTCKHEEELQRKPLIQRKADNSQAVSSELSQKIYSIKGSGHSLPNKTQQEMGAKIGADFSRVRVHTGSNAIQLNRELGARAFTVGSDIFFNQGQYNPNSGEGKRLMAHELVHVLHQSTGDHIRRQETDEMVFTLKDVLEELIKEDAESDEILDVIRYMDENEHAAVKSDPNMMVALESVLDDGYYNLTRQLIHRRSVCGPDITNPLRRALDLAESMFLGWEDGERHDRCRALVSPSTGAIAWDINQLYNENHFQEITLPYRCDPSEGNCSYKPDKNQCNCSGEEVCATSQVLDTDQLCGNTVEVSGQCHYAGTPNYIIFGKMMKLCYDHYDSTDPRWRLRKLDYTLPWVIALTNLYKPTSANREGSLEFARIGYNGSLGGSPPTGDRPGCYPECPTDYQGNFTVRWSSFEEDRESGRDKTRSELRNRR